MTVTKEPVRAKARIVEVEEDRAGQRIDNFLLGNLKGVPKSRVYRMIRKGEVRVNKGRIKASYRIKAGDAVRIPPVHQAESGAVVAPGARVLDRIRQSILVEEKGFLVLNKPSGIAVHGGSGLNYGIIEALRVMWPDAPYLELVHRLDRDTSGCLLIAKKRSVLREMHRLMRQEQGMEKTYLTLVKGQWSGGERQIDAPLLKNTLKSGERVVRVSEGGKHALSVFRPVKIFKEASLMEVRLMTGRTHQIRVHAAFVGHPIAGDEKYGDEAFNQWIKGHGLRRLFLHAREIAFSIPEGESRQLVSYRIPAPLGNGLDAVLSRFENEVDKFDVKK